MPIEIIDGPTIAAGESLSDGVDVSAGKVVRITLPGPEEWQPANMSFQFSSDGVYYNDMFNDKGEEIVIPNCPPRAGIVLSGISLDTLVWVKIRSGTSKHPVVQPAVAKFALAIQTKGV